MTWTCSRNEPEVTGVELAGIEPATPCLRTAKVRAKALVRGTTRRSSAVEVAADALSRPLFSARTGTWLARRRGAGRVTVECSAIRRRPPVADRPDPPCLLPTRPSPTTPGSTTSRPSLPPIDGHHLTATALLPQPSRPPRCASRALTPLTKRYTDLQAALAEAPAASATPTIPTSCSCSWSSRSTGSARRTRPKGQRGSVRSGAGSLRAAPRRERSSSRRCSRSV